MVDQRGLKSIFLQTTRELVPDSNTRTGIDGTRTLRQVLYVPESIFSRANTRSLIRLRLSNQIPTRSLPVSCHLHYFHSRWIHSQEQSAVGTPETYEMAGISSRIHQPQQYFHQIPSKKNKESGEGYHTTQPNLIAFDLSLCVLQRHVSVVLSRLFSNLNELIYPVSYRTQDCDFTDSS